MMTYTKATLPVKTRKRWSGLKEKELHGDSDIKDETATRA